MSNKRVVFLDGYLDEPSTLGVPPYLSPYSRYIYGLLLDLNFREEAIHYLTIDQLRQQPEAIDGLAPEWLVILAGTTVPGNYLGGKPITLKEIKRLAATGGPSKALLGPVTECGFRAEGINFHASERALFDLYTLFSGSHPPYSSYREGVSRWALLGARLTRRHPNFPQLVCELETYRGCLRRSNCLFCSERLKRNTYTRYPEEVVQEVAALHSQGNRYFRLGSQTDLLLYGARREAEEYPIPNPDYLQRLYAGIREAAPDLKLLHMDNAGPRSLVHYPEAGQRILKIIVDYNTPGDTAAMGLESADPAVLNENNIGTSPEETLKAVRMVNEIGGKRIDGVPVLLPGINLLHGLKGEGKKSWEHNYEFLLNLYQEGLMIRRINLRQVRSIGGYSPERVNKFQFRSYKERINKEINGPMLRRVFPTGTLLREVWVEEQRGKLTYGRPLGSYPLLIGIPGDWERGTALDVRIVDHGFRSVTALPASLTINNASLEQLKYLPGIGHRRAQRLFLQRPFDSWQQVAEALDQECDLRPLQAFSLH